jgi:hypothetical protein
LFAASPGVTPRLQENKNRRANTTSRAGIRFIVFQFKVLRIDNGKKDKKLPGMAILDYPGRNSCYSFLLKVPPFPVKK